MIFFLRSCFLFVVPHQWSQVSSSHPSTATLSTLSVPPPPAPEISAPSRSQIGEIWVALGATVCPQRNWDTLTYINGEFPTKLTQNISSWKTKIAVLDDLHRFLCYWIILGHINLQIRQQSPALTGWSWQDCSWQGSMSDYFRTCSSGVYKGSEENKV